MPGDYDALLNELEGILAKAQPIEGADDEEADRKIAEAAGDSKPKSGRDDEEEEEEEEGFFKSFRVRLPDGTEADAYDATAMMKALHRANTRLGREVDSLRKRLAEADRVIHRFPDMLKALTDRVAEQGDALRALRDQPAGRRAITAAPGIGNTGKSTREEVMAKAMDAFRAGRISGNDVAVAEARLNHGVPLPDNLARAIGVA